MIRSTPVSEPMAAAVLPRARAASHTTRWATGVVRLRQLEHFGIAHRSAVAH
jgi:hypothetical protein